MNNLDYNKLIELAMKANNLDMVQELLKRRDEEKAKFETKQKEFRQEAAELLSNLSILQRDMLVEGDLNYSYVSMEEVTQKVRSALEGLHLWYHIETAVDPNGYAKASLIISHENGYFECWSQAAIPFTDNPIPAHGIEASLTYARKAVMLNGFNFIQKDDDAVAQDGVTDIKINQQRTAKARSDAEHAVEQFGLAQQMKFEPAMQLICQQLGLPVDRNRANFTAANWEAIQDRANKLANSQVSLNI